MSDDWGGLDGLLARRDAIHAWARQHPDIRAAVAFGSTERVDRPADEWSDIDLAFLVDDPDAWTEDLRWVDEIAPTWLRLVFPAPVPGLHVVQVLFVGGYDADLVPLGSEQLLALRDPAVAEEVFGAGARVVVDHVGALSWVTEVGDPAPVAAPSREAFDHVVSVFLHQTVWAVKRLRRGELWRAHDDIDDFMRDRLRTMLEWHALARGSGDVSPDGRRLERWLPSDLASELPATFATYDPRSIAEALIRSQGLFARLGREVADRYGFAYPEATDAAVAEWVDRRLSEGGLPH